MSNAAEDARKSGPPRHLRMTEPSDWMVRFAPLVPAGGAVLDLASGGGRHARYFARRGHPVVAVDRNVEALAKLDADVEVIEADLEDGAPWPLPGRRFAAVVVCNYLYRPLADHVMESLAPGGVLLYETFARGNEAFNRPRNPDHLLRAGELLEMVAGRLQVVAFEHGQLDLGECPGVKQRICAINDLGTSDRDDGVYFRLSVIALRPLPGPEAARRARR